MCRRQERERKRNKRMTFVLSCIAITFAISFLPLHLFFTVTDLGLWLPAQNIKVVAIMTMIIIILTISLLRCITSSLACATVSPSAPA